jgi:RNA polymerase sigma-70 factor (ECF subfamily)
LTREEFKGLFDKYFDPVRSYIYYRCGDTELATDVAQEVFVKVWEKQFEIRDGKIKSLLYKMASDLFISKYRRIELERTYSGTIEFDYLEESPEEQMNLKELTDLYESALGRMNENQRLVFLMSRNDGLKYSEIAERLNVSVKAIEKRMNKALAFLRKELNYNG